MHSIFLKNMIQKLFNIKLRRVFLFDNVDKF